MDLIKIMSYICVMLVKLHNKYIDIIVRGEAPENVLLCNLRLASFTIIGSFQPDTSIADFIEFKTKLGGKQFSLSMLQFPLLLSIKKCVQCLNLTIRDLSSYLIVTEKLYYFSNNIYLVKFR